MNLLKSLGVAVGLTILLGLLPTAPALSAQALVNQVSPSPKLRGTVKDPSGGVMVGVDVAVVQGTRVIKAGKTDDAGSFSFEIPAGQYQLGVTTPDFKAVTQPIRATANMAALSITMSLEGISSVVEVIDKINEPTVDASLSLDAQVLTAEQINDLPDDEESLLAYLQALAGGEGNAQLIIDGFEGGRMPTRDQIAQIIIEPNSFNANGTGPRITIVSRTPGPTRWAGNASLSYRDAALNARNPGAVNKPPSHRSVVSTNYNGPVIKGKLGMTFNISKEQSESGNNSIRAVTPTGPVNTAFVSPSTYDSLGFSHNWYLSTKNSLTYSFNYNRNKSLNGGIGGFTLPERASDNRGHGWNFQVSDNKTLSTKLTNIFQFRTNRNSNETAPKTNAIAINVLDAFNGGGAQSLSNSHSSNYNMSDTLRWTPSPKWNFQLSFNANYQKNYSFSQNNYLGTFTFSSLDDYLAGTALTFTQTSGNPVAQTSQLDGNVSLQMTYRIKSNMSFSTGAQYGLQTHFNDHNNVSPTAQYQVQVKKRSIISIGARMTYPTVGFPLFYYEQLIRGDGTTKQFNTVISNPTYPDPFAGGFTGTTTGSGSSIQWKDPNLVAPYNLNTQVSLNETLPRNWRVTTSFSASRSVHQIRNRNINAPLPGTPLDPTLTRDQIDQLRPYFPIVSRISQFENTGNSISKSLSFTVQIPQPKKKILKTQIQGTVQYGLTWAADDNSVENVYDIHSDWARNDQRQRIQGTISVRPPRVGSFNFNFNANSGRAYSITTGKDDNFDQSINDRPLGVKRNSLRGPGGYTVNLNYSSPSLSIRKKKPATAAVAAGTPPPPGASAAVAAGISAQDSLIQSALAAGLPLAAIQSLLSQPGILTVVGNASPSTPAQQPTLAHPQLTFSVSVQNLLNNTRINGYSGVITSPLFGKPTGYGNGRSIQLSLNSRF
ncbi:MAG TPA: carboxypeptidase regulatory-like domain-containing protein [Terriglobia bacterium]|nr:carboxypeptidase regulatory-like domain-containing protein [Terriglobia bacterium]